MRVDVAVGEEKKSYFVKASSLSYPEVQARFD
jgi:hypothetical protein